MNESPTITLETEKLLPLLGFRHNHEGVWFIDVDDVDTEIAEWLIDMGASWDNEQDVLWGEQLPPSIQVQLINPIDEKNK